MHINAAIILAALSAVYKCAQSKTLTSLDGLNTKEVVIMPKVCTLERISQMSGYVCVHMELREVPQHLKADIEVSDHDLTICCNNEHENRPRIHTAQAGKRRRETN